MKTKDEILDECGVRIFGAQQARIFEAMERYAEQKLNIANIMQAEGSEETRREFCLWYYAQSQPLDANKVFAWFRGEGAAVGQRSGGTVAEGEEVCRCGNPSGEGNCHFEGFEELIYLCADCGKRVEVPSEEQRTMV